MIHLSKKRVFFGAKAREIPTDFVTLGFLAGGSPSEDNSPSSLSAGERGARRAVSG